MKIFVGREGYDGQTGELQFVNGYAEVAEGREHIAREIAIDFGYEVIEDEVKAEKPKSRAKKEK